MRILNVSFVFVLLLLTSCGGYNLTSYSNVDAVNTIVDLSNANYEILRIVEGSSEQVYVFGIGGLSKASLRDNAKADMYRKANLQSGEAIIYPSTTLSVVSYLGVVTKVRATSTGYKIRLYKNEIPKINSANSEYVSLTEEPKLDQETKLVTETITYKNKYNTDITRFCINDEFNLEMVHISEDGGTDDFYIGETEVTKGFWRFIMGGEMLEGKINEPISNISVSEVNICCNRLNDLFASVLPKGYKFDIPTVEQWKLAAKGADPSCEKIYSGSNNLNEVGWYALNTPGKYLVKTKKPNNIGLYDMSGGVSEICKGINGYEAYGGNSFSGAKQCKISSSFPIDGTYKNKKVGFRLVLVRK